MKKEQNICVSITEMSKYCRESLEVWGSLRGLPSPCKGTSRGSQVSHNKQDRHYLGNTREGQNNLLWVIQENKAGCTADDSVGLASFLALAWEVIINKWILGENNHRDKMWKRHIKKCCISSGTLETSLAKTPYLPLYSKIGEGIEEMD